MGTGADGLDAAGGCVAGGAEPESGFDLYRLAGDYHPGGQLPAKWCRQCVKHHLYGSQRNLQRHRHRVFGDCLFLLPADEQGKAGQPDKTAAVRSAQGAARRLSGPGRSDDQSHLLQVPLRSVCRGSHPGNPVLCQHEHFAIPVRHDYQHPDCLHRSDSDFRRFHRLCRWRLPHSAGRPGPRLLVCGTVPLPSAV